MWISFGEGFLLVFAINDIESFERIKSKREKFIKCIHGVNWPILIVGNKQDLEKERQVTYIVAKYQADQWNIEYIKTWAKSDFNCKEAFEKLARKIVKMKKNEGDKNTCCNIFQIK